MTLPDVEQMLQKIGHNESWFFFLSFSFSLCTGSSRRHQQRHSQATSAGQRGSVQQCTAALPHAELGLPAALFPAALPAHLSAVSGPLLARERSILHKLAACTASAAASSLAEPETEPGKWPAAPAPWPAAPTLQGVPPRSAAAVGSRHWHWTHRLDSYPWNTSFFRRCTGKVKRQLLRYPKHTPLPPGGLLEATFCRGSAEPFISTNRILLIVQNLLYSYAFNILKHLP